MPVEINNNNNNNNKACAKCRSSERMPVEILVMQLSGCGNDMGIRLSIHSYMIMIYNDTLICVNDIKRYTNMC